MTALLSLLLAALPLPAAAQCDPSAMSCPRAEGPQTRNWGQGDPGTLHAVFGKVAAGAKRERWAQENQGWFSKLIGRDPSIETKVTLDDQYLPKDSPLVADDQDGEPVVKVGRAALDAAQSEGEMAFLLGHELHHTLVRKRKRQCLTRGLAKLGNNTMLKYAPETRKYQVDLEREADAWGQRYAADAGFNPLAAVDAIRHVGDLGEALGADAAQDTDHDSGFAREESLKSYGASAPYQAACPWPES